MADDPKREGADDGDGASAAAQASTARNHIAPTIQRTPPDQLSTLVVGMGLPSTPQPMAGKRFKDGGELARGGMATIHEVFDKLILRSAAMKVFQRTSSASDAPAKFLEEAQITGQLDHPNIVPVYDVGFDADGQPSYFVMKLVSGRTLASMLGELGRQALSGPNLEHLLQIFLKICDAVAFAHSRGVIHRDLKPCNIMVGDFGQVYVMDWGIALVQHAVAPSDEPGEVLSRSVLAGHVAEPPGTLSGTPAYMAPEQAWGHTDRLDARTDVFGLGGILYEILTGRAPHYARDTQSTLSLARACRIDPPQQVRPDADLPPGLTRIALRALAPDPKDRYPSVSTLKTDVENFLKGGGWFESRTFAAGAAIVREGEAADAAYIIQSGRCRISRRVNGETMTLRELGPGDVFGETAIFGASMRTADVHALDEVSLLVVTRNALERELSRVPWLGAFVKALADRFIEASLQLDAMRHRT